ncbi:MAG: hypothetical protein K0R67_1861 [Paenibacillus sp.]|nr:hypothetical protein [Paenibacillus sp.]
MRSLSLTPYLDGLNIDPNTAHKYAKLRHLKDEVNILPLIDQYITCIFPGGGSILNFV